MNFLKSVFNFSWDIIKVAAIALVLAGLVRYFLVQPFFVEGASMEPNFETGEYLLIDELSYYFKNIGRGEVVVFHYPLDTSKYYIKRIIGLPGETV
ncbi:MAG: signal peptidase I, partial [Patescibacteria group bacterium]